MIAAITGRRSFCPPPPSPAARCKRCGTLPLHPECVADELERSIKAEWTSGRQTLATYTVRCSHKVWIKFGPLVGWR